MSFFDGGPKRPKFEGEQRDYRPKRPRFTAIILIDMLLIAILVRILQLRGYF